jgi:acetolactate synthase-1/2/3 large subunit
VSITCGELLVHLLEKYEVDTVFGIPGVHTVELYRGLPATRIRHITPRHEQGAGFMADGYARRSGKPGVCFIITGPGMTNISTAIAQAAADSVPMLVISSVNNVAEIGSGEGHLHELHDQRNVIDQLCAFSKTIWQPRQLPKALAEAFNVFTGSRPRPVHLQIPVDVITADAHDVPVRVGAYTLPPVPAPALLDQAAGLLANATRPLVCYGGGVRHVGQEVATRLAERLDAPVLLTANAKGLLAPGHPLSLGSNQSCDPVRELVRTSDAVLALGTEMGETDYDLVFDDGFPQPEQLIRVDIDPGQLNRPYLASIAIAGDAKAAVHGLLERLPEQADHGSAAVAKRVRQRVAAELPEAYVGQCAVLKVMRETLPGAAFVGDSVQPIYAGAFGFEAAEPGTWFNSATGYGTLGYGLPAAIGARLASDKPAVGIIGDGGIQFTLSELMTAVDHGIPAIILLWNNQGYGEIRTYMQSRDLPTIGVDIAAPDYRAVAASFGAAYARIESVDALQRELRKAADGERPTILEIDEADAFIGELGADYDCFS